MSDPLDVLKNGGTASIVHHTATRLVVTATALTTQQDALRLRNEAVPDRPLREVWLAIHADGLTLHDLEHRVAHRLQRLADGCHLHIERSSRDLGGITFRDAAGTVVEVQGDRVLATLRAMREAGCAIDETYFD